jgi:hypothetical protein
MLFHHHLSCRDIFPAKPQVKQQKAHSRLTVKNSQMELGFLKQLPLITRSRHIPAPESCLQLNDVGFVSALTPAVQFNFHRG